MKRRAIQIVGRFESDLSIPSVVREIARAAVRSNLFTTTHLYSTDHIGVFTERCKEGLYRRLPRNVNIELSNDTSAIGTAFGHPTNFHSWLADYAIKVGGILTEQDFVPPDMVRSLNSLTALWAPSAYVAGVYRHQGVTKDVKVFPHGIDPAFAVLDGVDRNDQFTFLSVSGIYQQRKGVFELAHAFGTAKTGDAKLILITALTDELMEIVRSSPKRERIQVYLPERPLGPSAMAHLLNKVHVYVAASKAEGFGLIPCEARACGTPTALTHATGHREHFRPGVDVEIPTTGFEWVPSEDADRRVQYKGRVPSVPIDGVITALENSYDNWSALHGKLKASIAERPERTWAEALQPLMRWMNEIKPQTGWSWLWS